jgi:hypothetical protein
VPLTLDATVGSPTGNSYTTVAGANALAAYRVGADAWAGLETDQKVQYIVMATRDLDTLRFRGAKATATQALEWPRTGTEYADDEIPARLIAATVERALDIMRAVAVDASADALNPVASNIKEDTVGPITTVFFEPVTPSATSAEVFSGVVQRLVASLLVVADAAVWGAGVAVRGS